ncbi:MAG: hypothetical protein ACWA5W_04500, partial [Phycisphaerales bacterium]
MTSVYSIEADSNRRVLWATLGVGFVLSVGLHLGAGVGVSAYFSRVNQSIGSDEHAIEMFPDSQTPIDDRDELQLGQDQAKAASIHWLGVIDNPQEGQAPIDEVEQAQLVTQVGAKPESSSRPSPEAMPERAMPEEHASQEQMPEEQADVEANPEAIEEATQTLAQGIRVDIDAICQRYPKSEERIRRILPAMFAVAD